MTYRFISLALCAACLMPFTPASALTSPFRPWTHDVELPKIKFVDESYPRSSVRSTNISELLQDYKILFSVTGHEQDLQKVLHQESSEIKNLIDCIRQVNLVYMVSPDCPEDDWWIFYTINSTIAVNLFLLDYYGIIELSTDDEKALYKPIKNITLSGIYDIFINRWHGVLIESTCPNDRVYHLPACWEERMRGLTIDKWASALKLKIQQVYSQKD